MAGGPQKAGEERVPGRAEGGAPSRAGVADRVRFLGQRSDVPRLMAAADVFCQPNTGPEPFGIVFVEALSPACRWSRRRSAGRLEIVDEACGVLTPPGDAAAVAAALAGLIRDPDRRRALGAAGPARAEAVRPGATGRPGGGGRARRLGDNGTGEADSEGRSPAGGVQLGPPAGWRSSAAGRRRSARRSPPLLFLELHNEIIRGSGGDPRECLGLIAGWGFEVRDVSGKLISTEAALAPPLIRLLAARPGAA